MNTQNKTYKSSQSDSIDLTNFSDSRLNSAGELSVSPFFSSPIYLQLGSNLLEVNKTIIDKPVSPLIGSAAIYYTIRNLATEQNPETVILDNTLQLSNHEILPNIPYSMYARQSVILGRDREATPELGLDESAHSQHLLIRLGSLAGNLHFMDLANEHSQPSFTSNVSLSPEDMHAISLPHRAYHVERDANGALLSMETEEQRNGRWTRPY